VEAYSDVMKQIIDKILIIIYNPEYLKQFLTDENYLNYLESLYQELSHHVEYSSEDKIMQYFKNIIKKNFLSNYEILDYIKNNLIIIKSNFDFYIKRVRIIQKDILFTGMLYGYYNKDDLGTITDKLEKYYGDYNARKYKTRKSKITKKGKKNMIKITNFLHNHILITRPYTFRTAYNINSHYTFNKNVIGNFYQIGKRDLRYNLMMTMTEMIWGNLFKLNISKKEKNKTIGNVITTSKKIIDNIMVKNYLNFKSNYLFFDI
jgi:hypothetical protein